MEHALDLAGRDLVVFVDASLAGPEPYAFTPVTPAPALDWSTHAMSPGAVLGVYSQLGAQLGAGIDPGLAPAVWLLAIRGHDFDLGAALSAGARANLEAAAAFLEDILAGGLPGGPRGPHST